MKNLLCAAALLAALTASAGENQYLGVITVSGASLTNATTAVPFFIPPGAKLTVYCSAAVNMLVDNRTATASGANKGVPVSATTLFPTSVGKGMQQVAGQQSSLVAVIGTGSCDFWVRDGNE